MTVSDLIIELQKVKNKDLPIAVFNQSDDDRHEILLIDDDLDISVDIILKNNYKNKIDNTSMLQGSKLYH